MPYHALQIKLGYVFQNMQLLDLALTHASMIGLQSNFARQSIVDNERLEFLGDAILGAAISSWLYRAYPLEPEGDLAKRRASLVCKDTLALVAQTLDLGTHLTMTTQEAQMGGRANPSILADTLEALIGAIFIDTGYAAAEGVIHHLWQSYMDTMTAPPQDAKSALQEWAQARGMGLPIYVLVGQEGPPHAPHFTVRVSLSTGASIEASATSKRQAEKLAATTLLASLIPQGRPL